MLSWFIKRLRLRAALILTAVYALSVVAPPVALAFADDAVAAHCLFEDSGSTPHAHRQSAVVTALPHVDTVNETHSHDVSGPKKIGDEAPVVGCCGFFNAPAVFRSQDVFFADQPLQLPALRALDGNLTGRGPDRLHRPPIAL